LEEEEDDDDDEVQERVYRGFTKQKINRFRLYSATKKNGRRRRKGAERRSHGSIVV
jgi:hypothetical protein